MPTEAGRKAARMAVQREIARTGGDGVALGRKAGVHAQTIQAFVNGSRWPALKTLGRIDVALGWPAGTLSAIAEGGYPEGVPDPATEVVVPAVNTYNQVLYVRPDGVSDEDWDQIVTSAQGYIEWQIQQALRGASS
jgi:hypothetical protein